MAKSTSKSKPGPDALRQARAAALLEIINERSALWLKEATWRKLRRSGFSRRDIERAVEDLLADGAVAVAQEQGCVVITPTKRRAGG